MDKMGFLRVEDSWGFEKEMSSLDQIASLQTIMSL